MNATLDAVIIGYNEPDLQTLMASGETTKSVSGAYNHMLYQVVRFRGKWMSYVDLFNEILCEVTNQGYTLHPMETPNLGVCYLSSFLTRRGFNVEIINFYTHQKARLITLLQNAPRAVVITTTFYMTDSPITELVQFIKQYNTQTKIIVGGPYIFTLCHWQKDSITQDHFLKKIGADLYINDSQGESALAQVLYELQNPHRRNLRNIPNIMYQENLENPLSQRAKKHEFIRTQKKRENNSLDENMIDWSRFPNTLYTPTTYMRTSRGCSFSCAFCNYPGTAGSVCFSSLEKIEVEMKQFYDAGVKNLVFIDDTFNIPLPRFKKILKMMIANKFDFHWFSFFRCTNADDEAFDLMQESGCKGVFLGIESGDQRILDNMNKFAKIEDYKDGVQKLKERGIITFTSFIVGFPGETRESVQNTITFIEETRPTYYKAVLYFYLSNSPIHQDAEKYGLHGGPHSWQHNTMDWREACEMIELMYTTIKNSVLSPMYIFNFWSIPYLFGAGISAEHLHTFMKLAQPLLVKNVASKAISDGEEEHIYQKLLVLGKEMTQNMTSEVNEFSNHRNNISPEEGMKQSKKANNDVNERLAQLSPEKRALLESCFLKKRHHPFDRREP